MKGSKRPSLARKSRFARRDQGEVQLAQHALTQRTEEVQHAQSAEETELVIWHRSARMPVRPPISRETYNFSESGHVLSHLSEEERQAAEESFSVYLRPIDLYEILQSRASEKPAFLTKCLHYKLEDKHKRRVQLSVSISRPLDDRHPTPSIFPLYILLARPVPTDRETPRSRSYRFKRAFKLTAFSGAQTVGSPLARFVLPDIDTLSTKLKSGSLAILLVHFDQTEIDLTADHMVSPSSRAFCSVGTTPIDFIHFSTENSPKISLGERAQFMSTADLKSCNMELTCSKGEKCLSLKYPFNFKVVKVPITITAEELGAKETPPLDLQSYNNSIDKLPQDLRPRTGEVIFHYRYYNNMLHNTQVTEDYTCPFCYLKCASFKGLECHLLASHDLFNYEFQGEGYYQVVNVSPTAAASSSEIIGELINLREKAFYFRSHRPTRRRKPERQIQNYAGPFMLDSNMPAASEHMDRVLYGPPAAALPSSADIIFSGPEAASQPESSSAPTTLQRFARSRKPSHEGHTARKQSSLQTHCSDHSRTAQPMALEPVNAEEDSEDEVDDEVAGLVHRRKLDRFVDVNQHDKQMMHLWNSFKREQKVLADANLPWTCEAFSTHHREDFLQSPQLLRCWKLFMVNLWNVGLIEGVFSY